MQGCNLSAVRCAGWQQPYSYRLMPERVAVAGISLFGVKMLLGLPFRPECAKPMQRHHSQR